jgi:hypothetical protein
MQVNSWKMARSARLSAAVLATTAIFIRYLLYLLLLYNQL